MNLHFNGTFKSSHWCWTFSPTVFCISVLMQTKLFTLTYVCIPLYWCYMYTRTYVKCWNQLNLLKKSSKRYIYNVCVSFLHHKPIYYLKKNEKRERERKKNTNDKLENPYWNLALKSFLPHFYGKRNEILNIFEFQYYYFFFQEFISS